MQYTQQQYKAAIDAALAAGDRQSAEELAEQAAELYGPLQQPQQPQQPFGPGIGLQQASQTLQEEAQQFAPEVQRRFARVAGEDPSGAEQVFRAPEMAAIGVSQAARVGGAALSSYIGGLLPQSVKEGAQDLFAQVQNTEAFKTAASAASKGYEFYQDWAAKNPAMAERFETSIDLGALFSPRPDMPDVGLPEGVVRGAQKEAREAIRADRITGTTKLIEPEVLPGDAVAEEVGLLRRREWQPNARDQGVIETLADIKEVNPKRSYTYNYRVVQKDIANSAQAVDNMVVAQNKAIDTDVLTEDLLGAINEFKQDPVFRLATGDAQKIAAELGEIALKLVQKHGTDLNGVLKARREFDAALRRASSTVLDAESASGRALAAKAIRNALNNTLKTNTRGEKLHNLLDRQHNGFLALDAMMNKRAKELSNMLARSFDRVKDVADLPSTPLALTATTSAGVAALGGAAAAAGTAAAGLGVYGAYLALKPKRRLKAYAEFLSGIDKAIKGTKDAYLLKQFEMDRALLVDLIDQTREETKEDE